MGGIEAFKRIMAKGIWSKAKVPNLARDYWPHPRYDTM
jgi:hypothetical protein